MQAFLEKLIEIGTTAGLKILYAAIILIVGMKLSKFVIKLLNKSRGFNKLDAGVRSFIQSALKIVLFALVFISAAYVVGIPITSFITILASCGLAIGLALQGALSNLAGGLMILIFKPFKVGDFIDANGKMGTVNDITIFYTIIHTADNRVVTIPNGTITSSDIMNYSALDTVRLDIPASTSYSDGIDKTRQVLLDLAKSNELVLSSPEPMVFLDKMNSSSLDYVLRVWVNTGDFWKVKFELTEGVCRAFEENEISIPFPQIDVHTDK